MDSFGGGGGFGGGGYMQDGGGFGSPMTDSQEKKVSSLLCFQEIKHTLTFFYLILSIPWNAILSLFDG